MICLIILSAHLLTMLFAMTCLTFLMKTMNWWSVMSVSYRTLSLTKIDLILVLLACQMIFWVIICETQTTSSLIMNLNRTMVVLEMVHVLGLIWTWTCLITHFLRSTWFWRRGPRAMSQSTAKHPSSTSVSEIALILFSPLILALPVRLSTRKLSWVVFRVTLS